MLSVYVYVHNDQPFSLLSYSNRCHSLIFVHFVLSIEKKALVRMPTAIVCEREKRESGYQDGMVIESIIFLTG